MAKFDVYGIGNALVDLQVRGTDEDLEKLGLTKGAMRLVNQADQQRIIANLSGKDISHSSGGAAANSMIALAQLGGRAAYGCIVANDERGEFYLEEMTTLGVTIQNKPVEGGEPTGTSLVIITPEGERTMNTHLGATAQFGPEHVNEELLKNSEWLFVEGYLFANEKGQAAISRAIDLAKMHNVKVALTFGDTFVPEVFRNAVDKASEDADLILANVSEAKAFTGAKDEEEVFGLLEKICSKAVMTLSERGAWIFWEGEVVKLPAFRTNVVDATGAGDMFAGAFLWGIVKGHTPQKSAELACFLASKVVSQLGARLRADTKELAKEIL